MAIQDEIIVLREIKYKDNDKILQCFSKRHGKIQIMAKNCRKSSSQNLSITNAFNHSSVNIFRNKEMYILSSGELINSFFDIKEKFENFIYANYILEILNHILTEDDNYTKIFDMTIKCFTILSSDVKNINYLIAAYELKMISFLGYRPQLSNCLNCGDTKKTVFFSIIEGGVICEDCKYMVNNLKKLNEEDIIMISLFLTSTFEEVIQMKNIKDALLILINEYFKYHIGKNNFNSLKLLGGSYYE